MQHTSSDLAYLYLLQIDWPYNHNPAHKLSSGLRLFANESRPPQSAFILCRNRTFSPDSDSCSISGALVIPAMPGILLGETFPNFNADTTIGKINFHEFLGGEWGVLFSHPRDYTPVCTTELGRAVKLAPEFKKRNVRLIALSIDSVADHLVWSKDINSYNCEEPTETLPFPIIADPKRELAIKLGMLDPDEKDNEGMPVTARCVFVIGPDKKMKLSILYPATTGRNFDEILRVVDSLQLTAHHSVATPVDWKPGDRVMVPPNLSEAEARKLFPCGVFTKDLPSGKKYLRYTEQPN